LALLVVAALLGSLGLIVVEARTLWEALR
jgi:hypothetical protein